MKRSRSKKHLEIPRLLQFRAAYSNFMNIAYSSERPGPADVVMEDWQLKAGELRAASEMAGFDLVELGRILDSARNAVIKTFPKSEALFDSVRTAASYLRSRPEPLPPPLFLPGGEQPIQQATRKRDVDFFIALGLELARESPAQDLAPDNLKWFLVHHWGPRWYGKSYWPGLAYMSNPTRVKVCVLVGYFVELDGPTLRGVWRRLGLVPAKSPFIRQVFRGGEASAPTIKFG